MNTQKKCAERIKSIVHGLLQRKGGLKNFDFVYVNNTVEIFLQIAATNLSHFKANVLPSIFGDKSSHITHKLIGLKVLKVICDKSSKFIENAACLQTSKPLNTPNDDPQLENLFEEFTMEYQKRILEALELGGSLVGTNTTGTLSEKFSPIPNYGIHEYSIPQLNVEEYILPPNINTLKYNHHFYENEKLELLISFHRLKIFEAIQRWNEFTKSSSDQLLDIKSLEMEKQFSKRVNDVVFQWCCDSNLISVSSASVGNASPIVQMNVSDRATLLNSNSEDRRVTTIAKQSSSIQLEVPETDKKEKYPIDLINEAISSLTITMPKKNNFFLDPQLFIAQYLIHTDPQLCETTSLTLQSIMKNYPESRIEVIQGMITLTLKYNDNFTACLETLLSHLIMLLDYWNFLNYQERSNYNQDDLGSKSNIRSVKRLAVSPIQVTCNKPLPETVIEGDALVLINLCHPNPKIRLLALQVANSLYALSDHNPNSLSNILFTMGETIVQKARFRYLLNLANGLPQKVNIPKDSPLTTIEAIALSDNQYLWSYTLAEICKSCTTINLKCLPYFRYLAIQRVLSLTSIQNSFKYFPSSTQYYSTSMGYIALASGESKAGSASTDDNVNIVHDLTTKRLNYHIVLYSTIPTLGAIEKYEMQEKQFWEYVHQYWNNLAIPPYSSNVENDLSILVLEEVYISVASVTPNGMSRILHSFWNWYKESQFSKKQKLKLRLPLVQFLRHLTQEDSFAHVIKIGN